MIWKRKFSHLRGGGGRPAPEPQGVQKLVPKIFLEDITRDGGQDQKNAQSPIETLVNTVSHMQRDLAILRYENRALRTPATSHVIQAPRRAALTTTKVPRFDGTTSWEQYHQVFEAILRWNGWDNDTAALQLFSHLEGDALNVAHLVPLARRLSRSGLVDALMAHHGSPGRLADYRRQFERTTRKVGEDPTIFAMALETLTVKAFRYMGQTGRLRLIRDIFIAGHDNCELRRHLDSVHPETLIRDVVDRCITKPTPDMTYPTYAVGDADKDKEVHVVKVAAVTGLRSDQNQLQDLIRRIVSAVEWPTPTMSDIRKMLLQLTREQPVEPAPVVDAPVPPTLEQMLRSVFDGQRQRERPPQRQR